MAKSERAKELAAKQKAEAKALRAKKRNSDNPRDWSTWKQIRESFKIAHQIDPRITYWLIGAFVVAFIVGFLIGFIISHWIWGLILGILLGIAAALFTLTWRTKKATYARYKGSPGAGEVALNMLTNNRRTSKKWSVQPAIAVNRQQDCIHRVVGAPGIILVVDGNPARIKPLLTSEVKKHQQILYNAEVHTVVIGEGPGQVPLEDVKKYIEKLPGKLDKIEVEELNSRIRGLDNMRSRMPIPKGPLPTNSKGARKAMRGR